MGAASDLGGGKWQGSSCFQKAPGGMAACVRSGCAFPPSPWGGQPLLQDPRTCSRFGRLADGRPELLQPAWGQSHTGCSCRAAFPRLSEPVPVTAGTVAAKTGFRNCHRENSVTIVPGVFFKQLYGDTVSMVFRLLQTCVTITTTHFIKRPHTHQQSLPVSPPTPSPGNQ